MKVIGWIISILNELFGEQQIRPFPNPTPDNPDPSPKPPSPPQPYNKLVLELLDSHNKNCENMVNLL